MTQTMLGPSLTRVISESSRFRLGCGEGSARSRAVRGRLVEAEVRPNADLSLTTLQMAASNVPGMQFLHLSEN